MVTFERIIQVLRLGGWHQTKPIPGIDLFMFNKSSVNVIVISSEISVKVHGVTAMTKMTQLQKGILNLPGDKLGGLALVQMTQEQLNLRELILSL